MNNKKISNFLIALGLIILAIAFLLPTLNNINLSTKDSPILVKPDNVLVQPQLSSTNIELVKDILKTLSGYDSNKTKRFLILSQDPLEIRPTGGFAGTYGEITVENGEIVHLKYDDIWKLDKELKKKGIQQINQSQWWAHFPRAAEEAMDSYKKATGINLDGIIAMDPTAMSYILEVIGPVRVEQFNETVDSKNLLDKILKYSPYVRERISGKPLHKQFLSETAKEIQKKLFSFNTYTRRNELSKQVLKSLDEKHMLIYLKDSKFQKTLASHNWAGHLRETSGDYLSVMDYNAGINKVNIFIDREIRYKADIHEDGKVISSIITKYHYNTSKTAFKKYGRLYGKKRGVYRNIQSIYLPQNISLLSSKYYDEPLAKSLENGKTVFKSMFTLFPGEKRSFEVKYEIPAIQKGEYSLIVQKQPGTPIDKESAYLLEAELIFPKKAQIDAYFPLYSKLKNNKFIFNSDSTYDFQNVIFFTI